MSWIHIEDVVAMIETAIDDERWEGAFNAVSPEPVTNRDFTGALGRALGRPTVLPAPGFAVRAMLGQMADALLLTGQRVLPEKAGDLGFEFRQATLEKALESLNLRA